MCFVSTFSEIFAFETRRTSGGGTTHKWRTGELSGCWIFTWSNKDTLLFGGPGGVSEWRRGDWGDDDCVGLRSKGLIRLMAFFEMMEL